VGFVENYRRNIYYSERRTLDFFSQTWLPKFLNVFI
jgi:hypothetical protein